MKVDSSLVNVRKTSAGTLCGQPSGHRSCKVAAAVEGVTRVMAMSKVIAAAAATSSAGMRNHCSCSSNVSSSSSSSTTHHHHHHHRSTHVSDGYALDVHIQECRVASMALCYTRRATATQDTQKHKAAHLFLQSREHDQVPAAGRGQNGSLITCLCFPAASFCHC